MSAMVLHPMSHGSSHIRLEQAQDSEPDHPARNCDVQGSYPALSVPITGVDRGNAPEIHR